MNSPLLAFQNRLKNIDLSGNAELSNLSLNNNELQNISLTENEKLSVLFVSDNDLSQLTVETCPDLVALACENNKIETLNLTPNTKIETLYCGGNMITELDLAVLKSLWMLSCEKNKIQSLKLPDSTMPAKIYCYSNELKESAMTELCQSLPLRDSEKKGMLFVVDTKDENEGNICQASDVKIALDRNWMVYDYRGNENGGLNPYEGIVNGIDSSLRSDEMTDVTYFNTQGMMSRKPFRGVNIVVIKDNFGNILETKSIIE